MSGADGLVMELDGQRATVRAQTDDAGAGVYVVAAQTWASLTDVPVDPAATAEQVRARVARWYARTGREAIVRLAQGL